MAELMYRVTGGIDAGLGKKPFNNILDHRLTDTGSAGTEKQCLLVFHFQGVTVWIVFPKSLKTGVIQIDSPLFVAFSDDAESIFHYI